MKQIILFTAIILSMFSVSRLNAQTYDFEKVTLHGSGSDEGKVVITIVGDGFTADEIGTTDLSNSANAEKFLGKARVAANVIVQTTPFNAIKDRLKIYAINVISEESGTGGIQWKNTFFEVFFIYDNIMYPTTVGRQRRDALLAQYAPTTAATVIIANKPQGGDVADPQDKTCVLSQPGIVTHELGHTLANLADEDDRSDGRCESVNLSATGNPETVRWKNFVGVENVTMLKYTNYGTWYSPGAPCRVSTGPTGNDFCAVCSAALMECMADVMNMPFYGTLYNDTYTQNNPRFGNKLLNTATTIDYPSGHGRVLDFAFHGCNLLQSVTIPADVTTIGRYAFLKCTGLTDITNLAGSPQNIKSGDPFQGVTRSNVMLHVLPGTQAAYEAAGWTGFNIVEDAPSTGFIVAFDAKGGATIAALTNVPDGTKITAPQEPTKENSAFEGWFKDAAYTQEWNFDTDVVTENITLYAKWRATAYTVYFDMQDPYMEYQSPIYPQTVALNGTVTRPSDPVYPLHTFHGWFKEPACINLWDFDTDIVTNNLTLYAKWTELELDEKIDIAGEWIETGSTSVWNYLNGPFDPAIQFIGNLTLTYTDYTKSYEIDLLNAKITMTVTVNPDNKFYTGSTSRVFGIINLPQVYAVSFVARNGNETETIGVITDEKITQPANPIRGSDVFVGWYTGNNLWNFETDVVTENITLYARYAEDVDISGATLTLSGDTWDYPTGNAGRPTLVSVNGVSITEDDYTISYEIDLENNKGTLVVTPHLTSSFVGSLTKDFSIINIPVYYDVTFNSQGGSSVPKQVIVHGEKVQEPVSPTRDGERKFGGWYKEAACTNVWDFDVDVVTSAITLYAKWTLDTCTVTFSSEYSTFPIPSQRVVFNGKVKKPEDPYYTFQIFHGWFKEATFENEWDFDVDVVTDHTTIYAKWTAVEVDEKEDIAGSDIFGPTGWTYSTGATFRPNITMIVGTTLGMDDYTVSQVIDWRAATLTLIVTVKPNNKYYKGSTSKVLPIYNLPQIVAVTFNSMEGSFVDTIFTPINEKIKRPADPTREGWVFRNWYGDEDLRTLWNFNTSVVTSDTVLYARWARPSYTITFDSRGGTKVDDKSVIHGRTITEPDAPTRENYTFRGWFKDSGYENVWDFETDTVTSNLTLYAKWTPNSCTVTFHSQEGSTVEPQTVNYGETITEPEPPTREGYTFGGWYSDSICETVWNFETDVVTQDTALYAKWTDMSGIRNLKEVGEVALTAWVFNGVVHISGLTPKQPFTIYNVAGIAVYRNTAAASEETVNVPGSLPSGTYIIHQSNRSYKINL